MISYLFVFAFVPCVFVNFINPTDLPERKRPASYSHDRQTRSVPRRQATTVLHRYGRSAKDIDGRLVDISNLANFAMMFVYDPITDKAIPCHISHQVVPVHFIERIKDFAVGKFTGRFLIVHILQLQKDNGIRLIAILLDEKGTRIPSISHMIYGSSESSKTSLFVTSAISPFMP